MSKGKSEDHLISLEDLVNSEQTSATVAGAPVPGIDHAKDAGKMAGGGAADPELAEGVVQIDQILSETDPEFTASMRAMKAEAVSDIESEEVESIDLIEVMTESVADEKAAKGFQGLLLGPLRLARRVLVSVVISLRIGRAQVLSWWRESAQGKSRELAIASLGRIRKTAVAAVHLLRASARKFWMAPRLVKLKVIGVAVLGGALFAVVKLTFFGSLMPGMEPGFLLSFGTVADAAFEYDGDDPMEDFHNPLLHPENVVLIERLIVNLGPADAGANSMGLFEFFIESSNREAAIEIRDRESEIRDLISRTVEQMPYDELVTVAGKNKLKMIVRHDLNSFLTHGRVRRVFYKTIVLKP